MRDIAVNLGERSYTIRVTSGELDRVCEFARRAWRGTHALVVCDENTERPFGEQVARQLASDGCRASVLALPPGEMTKSIEFAERIYGRLMEMAADRQTLIVAVGGGVIGDLAGFAAATYARGLPFLQVPTSLLAQVDSSVGGKVGVNYHAPDGRIAKNMIGAFYQPIGVFIDTDTLRALPVAELRAGLAEVVKYGVILDAEFFEFIETHGDDILAIRPDVMQHVVARSCQLKAGVVESDERETTDRRAVLNYGHTFAHAIEAVTREYRHGEAVAIGMVAASRLAERLGRVPSNVTERQVRLLERFGLRTVARGLNTTALLNAMRHDKKTQAGRPRFVLPERIGKVELVADVPIDHVHQVVQQLSSE
jgi:3-dehydroquinate synthase